MKIWLLQANEPMPIVHSSERLFRMGMLAKELSERGHEVTWFATTFDHFKKEQLYNCDTTVDVNDHYNLKLIWAPSYKKNISIKRIINHKYMGIRFRGISKTLQKPDIIYTSFPTIDFAEEAIRYGKKNDVPVIVDIRDLWPDIFKHNLSGIKRLIALPYILTMQVKTKRIMKYAYAINSISPKMVQWGLDKANRNKSKYDKCFYMGYDTSNETEIIESQVNIDKDKFNICFFGTLNNQFNFDFVIELANALKEYNVDIYICGLGEQFKKIKNASDKIQNIKLTGWLNKRDLQYILKNSKLGLAPYKKTFDFMMSVSNKFAEYLSYGLPVILTSGGYMGELIDYNKCGINSNEIDIIKKYICDLKSNEKEYEMESKNALNLFTKDFIAKDIYSSLVDYLECIIEEEKK